MISKSLVRDTILREMRTKTYLFFVTISVMAILLGHFLVTKFLPENANLTQVGYESLNLTFLFLNFWCFFVSGILGVSIIREDFNYNIIYQYLAFPISRNSYFNSRLIGGVLLVLLLYLMNYLLAVALFSISLKTFLFSGKHLLSFFTMSMYSIIVLLFSFLFSFYMDKLKAFITLFIFYGTTAIFTSTFNSYTFKDYYTDLSLFKVIGSLLYWLIPRLANLGSLSNYILGYSKELNFNISLEITHLILSSLFMYFLSIKILRSRDF